MLSGQPVEGTGIDESARRPGAFAQFEDACERNGLTATELAALPDDELEQRIREVMPAKAQGQPIEMSILRRLVTEYAGECGED